MEQKFIIGDIVEYDNKVMVVKEPRDGIHFDLSCPKEGLVYCFVGVDEIKPVRLTKEILEMNGWYKERIFFKNIEIPRIKLCTDGGISWSVSINNDIMGSYISYVHQLQHILFAFRIEGEMEV